MRSSDWSSDVCSSDLIIQVENLGFCEVGQGGWIAARGETALGGRIPVNPSGGLESKGHPISVTGLGQIHELVTQLRGRSEERRVGKECVSTGRPRRSP